MIKVFKLTTGKTCPRLTVIDPSASWPSDWVHGIGIPGSGEITIGKVRVVTAQIDRPPHRREFCALGSGVLAVKEDDLDGDSGPNSMYFALWKETQRVDLDVKGIPFACFIPNLTLEPDPRSGAPCRIDGVYASVFRIAGRPPTEIYCTSGVVVGGDEFPHVYDSEGFSGLDFELVWEGEAPQGAGKS